MTGSYTVHSRDGEIGGYDSVILPMPGELYAEIDGERVLIAQALARFLRDLADWSGAQLSPPEIVHHAEYVITSDPEEVRTRGLAHDCSTCRAGVDQALAALRDEPDKEMIVGTIYWLKR